MPETTTTSVDELLEQMDEIAAIGEERSLTPEEIDQYEELEAQLQAARSTEQIQARQAAYQTPAGPPAGQTVYVTGTDQPAETDLDRAFRSYLRTGVVNQDLTELRAQGEGAGADGGFTVPSMMRDRLVERMLAFGGLASVCDSFNTGTGAPVSYPSLDDTGNVGEIVNEGGTFTSGADLSFSDVQLAAYRYSTGGANNTPLRVSVELAQDSMFDIERLVTRALGKRIARIQAVHAVRGTGVNQPKGITSNATVANGHAIEIADDTAGVTYDDLVGFIHSVDPDYRDNGRWLFNDTSLKTLELIKDSNGDSIWRPFNSTMATGAQGNNGKVGQSGLLLGYPYTVDQAFLDIDVDNNTQNWGVFGDVEAGFVMRRVRDVVLIVNPWTRAANGQIEYTAWARMDANIQDQNAFICMTGEQP